MALSERLNDDMKIAMKSGEKARLDAVRYLLSLVQGAAKEKRAKRLDEELTDDEAVAVLQKEAKRQREAIALFRKGGRDDLVRKEEASLAVTYEYVPRELSAAEIEAMVARAQTNGASDFASLMRETMALARGRADGKTVGEIIKKKIG